MVSVEQLPIVELGVVILTSLMAGILFSRFKQSSALGYIAAGLLLGPLGLKVLGGEGTALTTALGELGVTMLLFYLGLELSIRKFKETGAIATVLAFVEMLAAFGAGFLIAKLFGFGNLEALVIGAMLTATSTVITGKFLIERNLINLPESRILISVLILEDFFALLVLVLITALATQMSANLLVVNALVFVVAMFFIVSKVSKHVLNILSSIGRQDQMWLYGIGVFLVVSYFGSTFLDLSPAIGAYFAGFALAESAYGERIKRELGLFREFFVLFFFVSFGATTTLPSDPRLWVMMLLLVAGYVLAKLLAHGFTGTAIGMELQSAVTSGILMGSIGEFALIIASSAAPLLPNAGDIRAVAFLLTIVTTALLPILYDRRERVAALFARVFPLRLQKQSRVLQRDMNALEKLLGDAAFANHYARALRRLFTQLVVALCIVYLSYLTQAQFQLPFLDFLPPGLSPGLLILPLIIWPIYKFIAELKGLTRHVAAELLERTFEIRKRGGEAAAMAGNAADVFAGLVLALVGVVGTFVVYYLSAGNYVLLVVTATYTLLALMYFSRSVYGLVEQYETVEILLNVEHLPPQERKVAELSKEFNEHARYFSRLHSEREQAHEHILEALESDRLDEAKQQLVKFKQRETKALVNLFDFSGMRNYPRLSTLVRGGLERNARFHEGIGDVRTRAAFQRYLRAHLKPHVFEPPAGSSVEAAAEHLIARDLEGLKESQAQQPPASTPKEVQPAKASTTRRPARKATAPKKQGKRGR